jgi:predicted dinucleotide-binding enzyme
MHVAIIGSGNVAFTLGRLIKERGHTITQVIGRNKKSVKILAKELDANASHALNSPSNNSDI